MSYSIGIDLGGTNLRVALYQDLERGHGEAQPVAQHREPVGGARSPAALVARITEVISTLLSEADHTHPVPIGVGIAAMLRGTQGVVANSPHLGWRDVPFGAKLRRSLGPDYPVAIYNDVDAITWGELRRGAGIGTTDLLAVFVGTGVGAGIIANGQLVRGAHGCAAELGHVKVAIGEDARLCNCGHRGCVEAYVGGSYLLRRARAELAGGAVSSAVRIAGGAEHVNPGHLDAAAAEGDDYALSLFAEIAPLLGVALANAVTVLNPGKLILGGGVLSRTPVFREHVIGAFEVAANAPALEKLEILDAALGDDAGLVGSALLGGQRA
jgi:glucokinase